MEVETHSCYEEEIEHNEFVVKDKLLVLCRKVTLPIMYNRKHRFMELALCEVTLTATE